MNIVSTIVGVSIMGAAAPAILDMSIAPMVAQKRAQNFGVAESLAVTFAANYEGGTALPKNTDSCTANDIGNRSWSVTCEEGEGRFRQEVTRAFRLQPETDEGAIYTNPDRVFAYETPLEFSHVECLPTDPWGVIWYNKHLKAGNMNACIPAAAFSRERYLASNPNDWLFDLSNFGFGRHPDY